MKAAFLGDPHFPKHASLFFKSAWISLYQSLYEQYSRLAFTNITDRPIGIHGLEERLIRSFNTRGAYGILELHLHRSLLWQRAIDEGRMERIAFQLGREVPTWSWMAYKGAIAYINIPLDYAEWSNEIRSPWHPDSGQGGEDAVGSQGNVVLSAVARDFHFSLASDDEKGTQVVFDEPENVQVGSQPLKCVVIGQEKMELERDEQRCFVLVVSWIVGSSYERVGAGLVPRHRIEWGDSGLEILIL